MPNTNYICQNSHF